MSAIQKRIIKELYNGTVLSVRNMHQLLKCSNISRELIRQFEQPFNIELNRKQIDWHDDFSSGYYYEYSLPKENQKDIIRLYFKYVLNAPLNEN